MTPDAAVSDPAVGKFLASLPSALKTDLRAQIKRKRDRALKGDLEFCSCPLTARRCPHDVRQSVTRPLILEMRWKNIVDEGGEKVAARLYFTEPEALDELTFLAFRAKYPERASWRVDQTIHMNEAEAIRLQHFGS